MNNYHEHQQLIKRFKILAQKEIPRIRIFDRTVGMFYTKNGNPIQIAMKGMADCYALLPTKICLIHIEIEFKTGKAVQTKEQKTWETFIVSMNGIYLLVRDEYDSVTELKKRVANFLD
jgi:hypothetical protein